MTATVRLARADDAPKIAACVDAAYEHYIARIGVKPGPMRTDYVESIRSDQVHVAEQDGRLVGALVLAVTDGGFLLEMISVYPSVQGTGVGRLLLEFSESEARRQGYPEIYLYTHEKMTENQALYSKIGYLEYDRRTEQGLARVYMRKKSAPEQENRQMKEGFLLAVLLAAGQAVAQMPPDVAEKLKAIGPVLDPPMIQATMAIYIPRVVKAYPGVSSTEDIAYGPDERHRLDVFAPAARGDRAMPVVLFVPGGGYVGGAKNREGVPFYQNVGVFFARNGVVGITMNYRLAPKAPWPAGGEDVAAALRWVKQNISKHGGDPERIFVFGQSAGGTHVAHYVFDERLQPAGGNDGVVGAILQSAVFDPAGAPDGANVAAYFGDKAGWAERSLFTKLEGRKIPLFLAYAELDPKPFRDESEKMRAALCKRDAGACPRTLDLAGHNHISEIVHLGSNDETFGRELLNFIRSVR